MADKSLFPRLQRLFSTDVVIRNVGDNQLKVLDINAIQKSGEYATNSIIDRFARIYSPNSTSLLGQQFNINYQYLRTQIYSSYDTMDGDAIIATALDIISDESSLKNDMGEVIQIKSSDEDIQKALYNLFFDVMNIEFNLWSWIRQMCKYGDFFLKLEIAEKFGVYNVIPYTAYHIERQEGYDKDNPSSVRFRYSPEGYAVGSYGYMNLPNQGKKNEPGIYFDNYETAHFRLLTDVNYLPYGRSYLEPARRLYSQYVLAEDAMLIHRITRSAEKRIFYINVGSIPPAEVEAFMQKTISTMKRIPYKDEQTGEYNLKYNMQNVLEDFYIPVRGNDSSTKIDTTKGLEFDGIVDVEYLRGKLFAALKVPKAFMGYEADIQGKATLSSQDIRFARTIDRIQRIVLSELYKIALIHLYTLGFRGASLVNFELSLTSPSIVLEQERVALLKEKVDTAVNILENKLFPSDWIYDHIFQNSHEEIEDFRDQILEDAKREFRITQLKEEGNDPIETGKSYGTPHDLATIYGGDRFKSTNVPDGYDETKPMGRPIEKASNINSQEDPLGKDRLGREAMKKDDKSVTIAENNQMLKNKSLIASLLKNKKLNAKPTGQKELFTESTDSLLNESKLKD